GIRDFHVTGVQTCALPIYGHRNPKPYGYSSGFGQSTYTGRYIRTTFSNIMFSKMESGVALTEEQSQSYLNYISLCADWVLGCNQIGRASCRERVKISLGIV